MADVEFIRFKKLLRSSGNFVTMPRMRLFALLQKHPALSMREVIQKTVKHDRVTVYRNINLFEKLGIINRIRLGRHTKIELSDVFRHHHHHMSCTNCGKVYILKDNHLIEAEITRMSQASGFIASDHQLEIRGLCQQCQRLKRA